MRCLSAKNHQRVLRWSRRPMHPLQTDFLEQVQLPLVVRDRGPCKALAWVSPVRRSLRQGDFPAGSSLGKEVVLAEERSLAVDKVVVEPC